MQIYLKHDLFLAIVKFCGDSVIIIWPLHTYIVLNSPDTTRELAGWLAGGISWLAKMAGWGAGWLAEAQKGPERPREAQRSGAWIEQGCPALGCLAVWLPG